MAETTSTGAGTEPEESGKAFVERFERLLDGWRGRLDELLVQVDLASKDVRDELHRRTGAVENAYLAARKRLGELPRDAGADLSSVRSGAEQLLDDLRQAYQAAEGAVRRSRDA